jgi:hypothetical protein
MHEHFHALPEVGFAPDGRTAPSAVLPGVWERGTALNEALAAWAARHFFREDPWMVERMDEYIRSGDYPVWPNRALRQRCVS